jgi:hypothetical protein
MHLQCKVDALLLCTLQRVPPAFFYLVSMLIRRRHDVAVSTGVDYGASYAFALQISICIANQLLSSCVHSSPTSGHLCRKITVEAKEGRANAQSLGGIM